MMGEPERLLKYLRERDLCLCIQPCTEEERGSNHVRRARPERSVEEDLGRRIDRLAPCFLNSE